MAAQFTGEKLVGQSIARKEDRRLLTGHGTFIEDMHPLPNIHHAAILRSPHSHARIRSIDIEEARRIEGVMGILTGEDVARMSQAFPVASPHSPPYYSSAIDKVRFVGEPVAVVVARDRYIAEDALDTIVVDYEALPAVVHPEKALESGAPILHEKLGTNIAMHRVLNYGEPDRAFAEADLVVEERFVFPKYASTPLETYGVIAHYERSSGVLTVWSNFHGPFSMQPVVARALGIAQNKLRFIVPADIGGGFGIKSSIYPYLTLIGLAAMKAGVPVKWIEDRREHLLASSSGTDRVSYVAAAVKRDGTITAMKMRIFDNVGAYLRAPEPGCVFRPLGNYVGGYKFRNLHIDAYCVLTNKSLTGPNRGYGCQHLYFGIERVVDKISEQLSLDPAEVRMRNLIPPEAFPYTTPTGGIYDAGDYPAVLKKLLDMADYGALREMQQSARKEGRYLGIGFALGVDPSVSNMGYVNIAQTPEERAKTRPKSGAVQATTISIDPLGMITVGLTTVPQGQGHETVVSQIVADELGARPEDITVVSGMDTFSAAWTIASGSYSSRFSSIGTSSAVMAARKLKKKMSCIAAHALGVELEDLEMRGDRFVSISNPSKFLSIRHIAGLAHWDPHSLPKDMEPGLYTTYFYSMPTAQPPDEHDRVDSSNTYGFMADLVVVEIDSETFDIQINKYVTVHDAGTILHPKIVDGQIRGAALHGIAGALYEELAYDDDGQLLTGTFMDYLCPTFSEAPTLEIGHVIVPSPFTVLGSKGLGESTTETAPVAIANAVSDALSSLGIKVNELPLTPSKLWQWVRQAKCVAERA